MEEEERKENIREYSTYVCENEDVIMNKKNDVFKIIAAFIKAGTNLETEIYPKMPNRKLYLAPEHEVAQET